MTTFLVPKLVLIGFTLTAPCAFAECSFDTAIFEGRLEVVEVNQDGFPTVLATPEDALSEISLGCDEGTVATLQVLPPTRADDNVPVLEAKLRSFFDYQGARYGVGRDEESVTIIGAFQNRPVRVGMSVGDIRYLLPASNEYRYEVLLVLTINETTP